MPLPDAGITIRLSDCHCPNLWISNMRAVTKNQFLGRPASPEGESLDDFERCTNLDPIQFNGLQQSGTPTP
jgi:hypothetical protein